MMEIQTKYSIGDAVYCASTHTETRHHPCPDCLGSKKWKAISPGGGEYDFGCPRCGGGYSHRGNDLAYTVMGPSVDRLTIGSVRTDTERDGTTYMCSETGVGSGRVYYERDLFPSHEEAMAAATLKAQEQTNTTPWVVERYNKSLSVSDYQLNVVAFEEQKRAHAVLEDKAWHLNYEVNVAVDHMKEDPDRYDLQWAVEHLRKGLAKFTGEEVGGVSPGDESAEEATPGRGA